MIILPLSLMAGVAMSMSAQSASLSLDEALKIAEQNAFSLRLADAAVEKARQKAREAKGALGPNIAAGATYTRFDKALTTDFGGNTITTRPIDSKTGQLSLSMPIDVAGVTGKAIRAANTSVLAAQASREAALSDLRQNVKRAYYTALQADEGVKVAEEALQRSKDRLKNVEAELAAGTRAKVDVIRLQTQVAQGESDLISAKNSAQLAVASLNNTLGRPIATEVSLNAEPMRHPSVAGEGELVDQAKASRPELKALRLQQEVFAFVRLAEERGSTPSLALSAVHSRTFGSSGFGASSASTTGTLTLSVPLWDSGITRARVKAARQDEETVKTQLEQATLGVALEVRQTTLNVLNAEARMKSAEQQVALAEENYRLNTIRFEAGEGIPLEVADASTQLTQAKTQLVNARYDYLRALADLERAIGKDLAEGGQ